jgi:hypothetical protein
MTTTDEPATNYHATVDDLRRDLVKSAAAFESMSERYLELEMERRGMTNPPRGDAEARIASLAAWGYGYTLAAVLKVAQDRFGEEVARTLAFEADEILTNGDFDDLNDDVTPEVTV